MASKPRPVNEVLGLLFRPIDPAEDERRWVPRAEMLALLAQALDKGFSSLAGLDSVVPQHRRLIDARRRDLLRDRMLEASSDRIEKSRQWR